VDLSLATAKHAGFAGDKDAIVEVPSGRSLTFSQLEERVDRLARALTASPDVCPGGRIAIMALNSIEHVEVYLAASRAGLIAQGINWRLATPEIVRVLQDSQPSVLVVSDQFADVGADLERELDLGVSVRFGPDSDGSYERFVASGTADVGLAPTSSESPVLLMYTGGSTGAPKGVLHTNESLFAAMVNNTVAERIVPSDRYMLIGQMFHSAAVLALNYLYNGATIVLVSRYETTLALETIEEQRVTAFLGFTTMMAYMLSELDQNGSKYELGGLRNLQYGGGPYAPSVIEQIVHAFPCGIIQNYGTTEHVGISFLSQEDHDNARAGRHMDRLRSGGRDAFLIETAIFDEDGRVVPRDGESKGEIFARSRANMVGYWNRPEETAKIRRGKWLGTGDVGVWDEDGYVYVVGRAKDMIISGAENIYAAEVERAIAAHPAVLETAVIGVPDPTWGEVVAAFVVQKPEMTVSVDEIQRTVVERLASYQKPRKVWFIEELPKSPNGKVLKQELRAVVDDGA
jgi:acyl-CoA synthetase (AMP-forming)/AMP-acid ligase II